MAEARRCRATRVRPAVTTSNALDDLHFIRQTLENSASFTAVPGWGMVGMAATALVAAGVAWRQPQFERWMIVWLAEGGWRWRWRWLPCGKRRGGRRFRSSPDRAVVFC